jgi:hypothetical protein
MLSVIPQTEQKQDSDTQQDNCELADFVQEVTRIGGSGFTQKVKVAGRCEKFQCCYTCESDYDYRSKDCDSAAERDRLLMESIRSRMRYELPEDSQLSYNGCQDKREGK